MTPNNTEQHRGADDRELDGRRASLAADRHNALMLTEACMTKLVVNRGTKSEIRQNGAEQRLVRVARVDADLVAAGVDDLDLRR